MVQAGEGTSPNKDVLGFRRLLLWACGHRAVTALIFVCTLVAYWERVGFSIAFTDIATEMGLSETEKGYVFAAYYSGYALTQIPGGYLTRRYGGKATLALSFSIWTPASILMTLPSESSDHAVSGFLACRLIIGMGQGMLVPASQSVLGHWVPSAHRGRYFALAMAGKFAGAAIAMVTVPIVVSGIDAPTTFYIASCMGAAWLAVWVCAGSDAPRGGGEAKSAEWSDAAQSASGSASAIHQKSGLEGGGDRPKGHRTEAGRVLGSAPKPWASANARLCQSAKLYPARSRMASRSIGDGAPTSSDSDVLANPATQQRIEVCDEPSDGESASGAEGTTVPVTPTETQAKPVRTAVVSGDAVSGSTPAVETEGTGRGRGSDGRKSVVLCISSEELGVGVDHGCPSGIRTDDELFSPPALLRPHQVMGGAHQNAPSVSMEETSKVSGDSSGSSGRGISSGNGSKEFADIIVQTQTTPAFPGRDPPARETTVDKTRAVSGRSQAKASSFPWKAMSRSPAAWACVAGGVGSGTGVNVVMSWLPTYFEEFFRVDLEDLGLVSLLAPYLTMMAFSILGGVVYCWLINTRETSVPRASKLITGFSFALAVGFLLSMGLATSPTMGTVISSLALASVAFSRGGWSTNHLEIAAPEHAAMLFSIANSSGSAASVAGIAVVGKLLDAFGGSGESLAWIVAMGVIGAICGACGFYFVIFAKGDKMLFPAAPGKDAGAGGGRSEGEGSRGKDKPRVEDIA